MLNVQLGPKDIEALDRVGAFQKSFPRATIVYLGDNDVKRRLIHASAEKDVALKVIDNRPYGTTMDPDRPEDCNLEIAGRLSLYVRKWPIARIDGSRLKSKLKIFLRESSLRAFLFHYAQPVCKNLLVAFHAGVNNFFQNSTSPFSSRTSRSFQKALG